MGGKCIIQPNAVLRGDLRRTGPGHAVSLSIGSYVSIGENVVLRPPFKTYKGAFSYYPIRIGDHVWIGDDTVIEAAAIGSGVHIGKDCVIGRFCMIKDGVWIDDGVVLAPYSVIPPFSVL